LNLIITCQRNLEQQTIEEISKFLDEFGDSDAKISKTQFSGIIQATTSLDISKIIQQFREKINDEPWLFRFSSRIIPIQKECKSDLNIIKDEIQNSISCIKQNQSYRITIEKRDFEIKSKEIISEIANLIPNKVSLERPDWEIVIQVMGKITGIGIFPSNSILSVSREKRLGSN